MNGNYNIVIWITFATLLGKILGVLRDILISYYYGSSDITDAFFLAISIPTIILGIFTASTDSAVIPQYNRIKLSNSRKEADKLFSSIVNTLSVVCSVVCVTFFVFPKTYIKIFAMGFDKQALGYCEKYLQIFAPIGMLHMLYCFYCAYCTIYKKNSMRVILSFSTNLIVVCALLIWHDTELIVMSIAFLVSELLCAVLPILQAWKSGYRHKWQIQISNAEYHKFWYLFLPIMGGAFLNDFQQYIDKNLASNIVGGISTLTYASKLITVFDSILVVGIGVVLLPRLSEVKMQNDSQKYKNIVTRVTKYLLMLLIPCCILLFSLSGEIISVVFGRGKFNQESINIVSKVLKSYAPLIIIMPIQAVFSRFFYALEQNNIPFNLNLAGTGINIILSIFLLKHIGLLGISFATTVAVGIIIVFYAGIIYKKIGWDKKELNIGIMIGFVLIMGISLVCVLIIKNFVKAEILRILLGTFCVLLIFFGGYMVIVKNDMRQLYKLVKAYIKK